MPRRPRLLATLGAAFELTLGTDERQSPERGLHALLVADAKPQPCGVAGQPLLTVLRRGERLTNRV